MKKSESMVKTILLVIILMIAYSQSVIADEWIILKGSLSLKNPHSLNTFEAGANLTNRISIYGFADLESTQKNLFNMNSIYAEGRITIKANNLVGGVAEFNCGTEYADTVRLGVALNPDLGKENFTFIKLFPYETSGEKGPQVSLFTSQKLTKKLTVSLLADYNATPKTLYFEPTLEFKLCDSWSLFVQGRSFNRLGKYSFTTYLGISKSF